MPKPEDATNQPPSDDLIAALQGQIVELNERLDVQAADFRRWSENLPLHRIARLERVASIVGGILCELHTNQAKSDISGLQIELAELLKPLRRDLDAPAAVNEEAAHAAA